LTLQGQAQEGLSQLRHGLESWQALGHKLARNQYLFLLADAYREAGQPDMGLTAVAEGLAFTQQTAECAWEAELHRLQGELLLLLPADHKAEAETCFQKAIAAARRQQTKSWELRAATSLARLWQAQGKHEDAYDLLAPVYEWFTEGFETADLQDARALLEELA
jgi:predicted ATPase